jgi:hypothetical protein
MNSFLSQRVPFVLRSAWSGVARSRGGLWQEKVRGLVFRPRPVGGLGG